MHESVPLTKTEALEIACECERAHPDWYTRRRVGNNACAALAEKLRHSPDWSKHEEADRWMQEFVETMNVNAWSGLRPGHRETTAVVTGASKTVVERQNSIGGYIRTVDISPNALSLRGDFLRS